VSLIRLSEVPGSVAYMLQVLIINCTLKPSPQTSNTEALTKCALLEFRREDAAVEIIRMVDYNVLPGTSSYEGDADEWPTILEKIKWCDILIVASPVWVGHTASPAQRLIERMDAFFYEDSLINPTNGQYLTYNKVAGVLVTGNEDGAHSVVAHLSWALSELGFTIPPNSNAYWVNKSGAGKSFIEAGGDDDPYTNTLVLYTVHNLIFFANLLREHPISTNLKALKERAEAEVRESNQESNKD
jgi:multimeric flavodoxin WrbA